MGLLDFYNISGTADTGYNNAASIQPILDGEPADQAVFQRPSEDIRVRTELLRTAHDMEEFLHCQDRGMVILPDPSGGGDPVVTWDGVGGHAHLTVSDIILATTASTVNAPGGVLAASAQPASLYHDLGAGKIFSIVARSTAGGAHDRTMHEGAGNIFFRMFRSAAGNHAPIVTITGAANPADGPTYVTVELSNAAGVTDAYTADVVPAINAVAGMNNVLLAAYAGADQTVDAGFITETSTRMRLFEFPTYGVQGVDATSHRITQADLSALTLNEGNMVVVDFASANERHTDVATGAGFTLTVVGVHQHSNIGGNQVFPLCKVFDGELYFFNGIRCPVGVPTSLTHVPVQRLRDIDVDSRPWVVVDAAGNGDYATIQAAITALGAAGGMIYILSGTYTENLSMSVATSAITLIGQVPNAIASPKVLITNVGAVSVLSIDGPHNHRFSNITFKQTNSTTLATFISTPAVSGDSRRVTHFVDCTFVRTTASATTAKLIETKISVSFESCQFLGLQTTTGAAIGDYGIDIQTDYDYLQLTVRNCDFSTLGKCINQSVNTKAISLLEFTHNVLSTCGYSVVAATWNYLLQPTAEIKDANICYNYWPDVAAAASECGGFFHGYGSGIVGYNVLERTSTVANAVTAATAYVIVDSASLASEGKLRIVGNTLANASATPLLCVGGIRGTIIIDNILNPYAQNHVSQYAIRVGTHGIARGNRIIMMAAGSASMIMIYTETTGCVVTENYIGSLLDTQIGITVASDGGVVSKNYIKWTNSASGGTAIDLVAGSNLTRIENNTISGGQYGVYVTSCSRPCILNNYFSTAYVTSYGVYCVAGSGHVIQGNTIYNYTYGIRVAALTVDFNISNNTFSMHNTAGATCIIFEAAGANYYSAINGNIFSFWHDGAGHAIDFGHANTKYIVCSGNMFALGTAGGGSEFNLSNNTIGIGTSGACVLTSNWFCP